MANYEQLFLLEVLVDRVRLLTTALEAFAPECEDEPDTPVRIRVKFSDFPCFEITQDLAPPERERKDSDPLTTPIVFSSGKSCMFPMDPEQLIQDLIKYPMAVSVFKKNPQNPLPEIIGQTKVPLGDYMSNIIKRAAEWSLEEPLSEMLQDTFPLRNIQEQDVGTITMLIRLTCFGKTIITKFQIADNKKSFLFKNAKTQDYEFKCKKCMPGQPILRPRPYDETYEDEECEDWDEKAGYDYGQDGPPLLPLDREQMTQTSQFPITSAGPPARDASQPTPGFQRHEFQGPGFTAGMEVAYPDDGQDGFRPNASRSGLVGSQSAPTVKKDAAGKSKRGKSLDAKKIDVKNGVSLGARKKKKKTKFHVPQGIAYPGVILGHKYCVAQGPPIPAKNGWAWKTSVPCGMTWEDVRGWRPGAYKKSAWLTIKAQEELRKMGKRKRSKRKPLLPDTRKTTVHIHRIKGIYHVTMNPVRGPDDTKDPDPVVYTLERPEDGSDASEIELDLTVPDPPYPPPPPVKHQGQQFCEEDLPIIPPKSAFVKKKKKKKKEKDPAEEKADSKKKPGSAKSKGSAKDAKGKSAGKEDPKKDGKGAEKEGKGVEKGGKGAEKGGKGAEKGGKGAEKGGKGAEKGGKGPEKGGKGAEKGVKGASAGKGTQQGKGAPPAKGGKGGKETKGGPSKDAKRGKTPETAQSKGKKGKAKKKGDEDDDVYPWEEWIMKLKCKKKHTPED